MKLTAGQLKQFDEEGYLFFPGEFSAEEAAYLKQQADVVYAMDRKEVWRESLIPGFRVDATDTTAAGDTFNGAFVTGLLEDLPLESAIKFAHAAAAISVTRFGAQTSIPTREEVDAFLAAQ